MIARRLLPSIALVASASGAAASLVEGCTTPASTSCTSGTTVACTCASGQSGTQSCGVPPCSCDLPPDAGADAAIEVASDADVPGDATHRDDQAAPSVTYACAVQGGFGWPCSLDASGPDPQDCTDPRFPICFAGAQGSRCTALCADGGFAACPVVDGGGQDAGCVPFDCNVRGFCK